jgi:hypothetical protein
MKRRIQVSLIAFSLFSLVGPLIRVIFPTAASAGRLDSIVSDVVLYTWPTIVFAAGPGEGNSWRSSLELIASNALFFVLFGLLVGLLASRVWAAITLYVVTCAALFSVEAFVFKSSLGLLSWCVLAIVFLLYAIPFWAVRHMAKPGVVPSGSMA